MSPASDSSRTSITADSVTYTSTSTPYGRLYIDRILLHWKQHRSCFVVTSDNPVPPRPALNHRTALKNAASTSKASLNAAYPLSLLSCAAQRTARASLPHEGAREALTSAREAHQPCGLSLYHLSTHLSPNGFFFITAWNPSICNPHQQHQRHIVQSPCLNPESRGMRDTCSRTHRFLILVLRWEETRRVLELFRGIRIGLPTLSYPFARSWAII
jgi:hypothetical protein